MMRHRTFQTFYPLFGFLLVIIVSSMMFSVKTSAFAQDAGRLALTDVLSVDPQVTVGILENGLRYYIRENKKPENRAELRLAVNVGSIVEADNQQGLAHFTEHMAFNGTAHFQKQELVNYLESVGMRFGPDLNAYTSFDETVYMLTIPTDTPEIVSTAFQILKDWVHSVSFESAEIDRERGVVIEEWRIGQGAGTRLRNQWFPVLFQGSRYAERLPIGKKEILDNFEHETVRRFYRDWYRPDLMAIIAVGDFDKTAMESLIREQFADIPSPSSVPPRTVYEVPDHAETLFAIAADKEATSTQVTVYHKLPVRDQRTVGDYRRMIVEQLFNNMLNVRLYELTQQSDPPFIGAYSSSGRLIRSKEVYLLGAQVKEDGIERGLEATLTEAERVAQHGFTASELERMKTMVLRQMEQAYNERDKRNSGTLAQEYIRNFTVSESIPGIEMEYELFKRFVPEIAIDDVNALAREWITVHNRVIVVTAPEKEGLRIPDADALSAVFTRIAGKETSAYKDLVADVPLVDNMPSPGKIIKEQHFDDVGVVEWTLSNGARVVLKQTDFKADEIRFRAFSPGGTSLAADADYIPVSTAAQVIAAGGLGAFSAIELPKKLAGKIANVQPRMEELYEGLSGQASPRDIETLLQLVYLTFTAPRADPVVFQSIQSRLRALLENRSASPEAAFQDTLQVTLSQYHHRSRPMTPNLLEEMDLEKSYAFMKDRFADAGDFTFILVGNIDVDAVRPLVQRYLGGLPAAGRTESWRDVGEDYPRGVIRKTVYKGSEPKSQTSIVFTGPCEYSPVNHHVFQSLSEVLNIQLRERIREELGGTYGVRVQPSFSRIPDQEYSLSFNFGAEPERVEELTAAIFQVIDALKQADTLDEYIHKVQEAQRRSRETDLKENSFWLTQLAQCYMREVSPSEILNYDALVDALDTETIRNAARLYLNLDNYVQVTLLPETVN